MACILVIAVSVNVICLNIEYSLINKTMTGSKGLSNETAAESKELVEELTNEGVVLLKNDSNSLPVSKDTKLNIFGWGAQCQSMEEPVPEACRKKQRYP